MAASYFDITLLPKFTIQGVEHRFRVTARNPDGTTDAAFAGTASFSTTGDALAVLPANYTFTGPDAGVRDFEVSYRTLGAHTLTATSGAIVGNASTTTTRPPGWGLDDKGLLPYGDAASIGAFVTRALAVTTRQVDVTVSNFVLDNSPFLTGDALNPSTWAIQRLDTAVFLNVVGVEQVGTFTYRLLTLEEFGAATVPHRASTSTLLDLSGNLIGSPRQADFLGLLEAATASFDARLAKQKTAARDFANAQVPGASVFGGTLQLTGGGDYQTVTGTELTKKLIIRRLISRPGDFFHLPDYGIGLRVKEPVPLTDLPKLKKRIEQQVMLEPEVEAVSVRLTLEASRNLLSIQLQAREKKTGQSVEIGFKVDDTGVVL